MSELDGTYWGGWTESGKVLHLAATSVGLGHARSACGLVLSGGSYDIPGPLRDAKCHRCVAAERRMEQDELAAIEDDETGGAV